MSRQSVLAACLSLAKTEDIVTTYDVACELSRLAGGFRGAEVMATEAVLATLSEVTRLDDRHWHLYRLRPNAR